MNASLASNHEISLNNNEISAAQQKEDLEFLKYCMIGNIDENILIDKLNSTRELRNELMSNEDSDIRTNFPFFLSKPELVNEFLFDSILVRYIEAKVFTFDSFYAEFQILLDFREKYKYLISACNFLSKWPSYGLKLKDFCDKKFECESHTDWNTEIESILLVLKLFPSKPRKNKRTVQPFRDLINKLIIYKVVL